MISSTGAFLGVGFVDGKGVGLNFVKPVEVSLESNLKAVRLSEEESIAPKKKSKNMRPGWRLSHSSFYIQANGNMQCPRARMCLVSLACRTDVHDTKNERDVWKIVRHGEGLRPRLLEGCRRPKPGQLPLGIVKCPPPLSPSVDVVIMRSAGGTYSFGSARRHMT